MARMLYTDDVCESDECCVSVYDEWCMRVYVDRAILLNHSYY